MGKSYEVHTDKSGKRTYSVDVGNLSAKEATKFIEKIMEKYCGPVIKKS